MKSYLTDRKQFVYFDGSSSCILSQGLGVIQGSKCGPLLYDIYSSDISKIYNERREFCMYADDTCLMFTNDNIEEPERLPPIGITANDYSTRNRNNFVNPFPRNPRILNATINSNAAIYGMIFLVT